MKKTFTIIKIILVWCPIVLPAFVLAQFYAVIPYYAPDVIPNYNPYTLGDHVNSFGNYAPVVLSGGNPQRIAASAAQAFPSETGQTFSGGGGYAQTASVGNAFGAPALPKLPKTGGGGRALMKFASHSDYNYGWLLAAAGFSLGFVFILHKKSEELMLPSRPRLRSLTYYGAVVL